MAPHKLDGPFDVLSLQEEPHIEHMLLSRCAIRKHLRKRKRVHLPFGLARLDAKRTRVNGARHDDVESCEHLRFRPKGSFGFKAQSPQLCSHFRFRVPLVFIELGPRRRHELLAK
eukprot:Amastigsp_a182811_11.p3 type:complete len:115 gc:universal Amastigsp_a182811_11:1377-1721(+)